MSFNLLAVKNLSKIPCLFWLFLILLRSVLYYYLLLFRYVLFISAAYSGFVKKINKAVHVWLNLKPPPSPFKRMVPAQLSRAWEKTLLIFHSYQTFKPHWEDIRSRLPNDLCLYSWLPHPQESGFFPQSFGPPGSFHQEITFSSAAEWAPWPPWLWPPKTKQESV